MIRVSWHDVGRLTSYDVSSKYRLSRDRIVSTVLYQRNKFFFNCLLTHSLTHSCPLFCSYMASHVFNPSTKFEYPRPIRSWVELWRLSLVTTYNVGLLYLRPLRMHQITWPAYREVKNNYIFGFLNHNLPIHYATYIGYTMTIKGRLHARILLLDGFR